MKYQIGDNCKIADSVVLNDGVILGNNVIIDDNAYIDYGVIIRDNVHIMQGTTVGARCILGEFLMDFYTDHRNKQHPLVIGENSIIRSETIIYGDTVIGDGFQSGHRVTIREKAFIGHNVRVGTLSDIQGDCTIGNYVSMHSNVHIGQKSIIKDYAWIYPYVVLTNDPTPPSEVMKGVTVNEYAVVATGSIIMPGVSIGKNSLVGAGAIVTKDVPDMKVFVGNPAKELCDVTKIRNKITGETIYPWHDHFDRGMPWQGRGYANWIKE
jgi:acetyltransferase-like isoleucine patch superfamily enzyme